MKHLYRQKYNDDRSPGIASRYWCDSRENSAPLSEAASTGQISQVSCDACLVALVTAVQAQRERIGLC